MIFDDPQNIEEILKEHTKEHFKFFKKINNFNYLKDPKALQIPIPLEYLQSQEEDVAPSNVVIRNFLINFYDNRIKDFESSRITFKQIYVQWNMFYLNPSYFS